MSDHTWHSGPDRTNDPEIKRNPVSRLITNVAKRSTRGKSYQFMRVLSISGRLHVPYLIWNSRLMPSGKLPRKQTEAVILRTAWLCGSEYEWTQHSAIGRRAGLTEQQVEAAGPAPDSELFDAQTRTMLAGVEELLTDHKLSDATYDALRAEIPPKLILEYVMLVGTYSALAGSLNTFGAPLESAWQRR